MMTVGRVEGKTEGSSGTDTSGKVGRSWSRSVGSWPTSITGHKPGGMLANAQSSVHFITCSQHQKYWHTGQLTHWMKETS